ncbi:hypothetical protein RND81_14G094600 [Saponaria officinalis]|uniref:Uncharacterized protein n=1 Tax=Saponaria officinalis TaxID=3572 RepID=A0AAW1GJN1_SAPOF
MISVSTSKSGSNWLDRLRSSRGFPTGDEPDLDRFLASSSSCSSGSSTRSESTQFARRVNSVGRGKNVAGEFSDVLCDLFNMGECSRTFSKRNCRKQSNPRFFNFADFGNKNKDLCSSSGDNSLNDKNHSRQSCDRNNGGGIDIDNDKVDAEVQEVEEEEDEGMNDMKEYTRSEVTVIDTSLSEWKIDKWVFRKKDEWKIKDKKKSKFNAKKKKLLASDDDDDDDDDDDNDESKKRSIEGGDIEEQMTKKKKIFHLNKNDKARELLKEAAEFVGKVPPTRCPCPRPPDKLRIDSSPFIPSKPIPSSNNANPDTLRIDKSPVILLKSIPSINNANGITRLGKSAKKGRPKKFTFL